MKKIFWIIWIITAIAFALHYASVIFHYNDLKIMNIEHQFYLILLCLAVISMLNIRKGKVFLFLGAFSFLSCVYLLPELDEINALNDCYDGNCTYALKMNIVKIENDRFVYIPKAERKINP